MIDLQLMCRPTPLDLAAIPAGLERRALMRSDLPAEVRDIADVDPIGEHHRHERIREHRPNRTDRHRPHTRDRRRLPIKRMATIQGSQVDQGDDLALGSHRTIPRPSRGCPVDRPEQPLTHHVSRVGVDRFEPARIPRIGERPIDPGLQRRIDLGTPISRTPKMQVVHTLAVAPPRDPTVPVLTPTGCLTIPIRLRPSIGRLATQLVQRVLPC